LAVFSGHGHRGSAPFSFPLSIGGPNPGGPISGKPSGLQVGFPSLFLFIHFSVAVVSGSNRF